MKAEIQDIPIEYKKSYFYFKVNQALEEAVESLFLKVLKPDWTQSWIHSAFNRRVALDDLQRHLQPFYDFIKWAESWTNNSWLIPLPIKTALHLCIFHCFKKEMKILFLERDASNLNPGGSGSGVCREASGTFSFVHLAFLLSILLQIQWPWLFQRTDLLFF